MGWEWLRKRKKKILVPNPVNARLGQDNSKKNSKKIQKIKKTSFWHYIYPKWVASGWEREKKNLVPNSVHTRPGQENCEKYSKRIQKIKKPNLVLFLAKTGMR